MRKTEKCYADKTCTSVKNPHVRSKQARLFVFHTSLQFSCNLNKIFALDFQIKRTEGCHESIKHLNIRIYNNVKDNFFFFMLGILYRNNDLIRQI